jgi:integrase/recombinase XerD
MTQNNKPISPLRQRMIGDMRLRKLSPKTQRGYVRTLVNFTRFLERSPDQASAEDLRRFELHRASTGVSRTTINAILTGVRFFFEVTLERPEAMRKMSSVRVKR